MYLIQRMHAFHVRVCVWGGGGGGRKTEIDLEKERDWYTKKKKGCMKFR